MCCLFGTSSTGPKPTSHRLNEWSRASSGELCHYKARLLGIGRTHSGGAPGRGPGEATGQSAVIYRTRPGGRRRRVTRPFRPQGPSRPAILGRRVENRWDKVLATMRRGNPQPACQAVRHRAGRSPCQKWTCIGSSDPRLGHSLASNSNLASKRDRSRGGSGLRPRLEDWRPVRTTH